MPRIKTQSIIEFFYIGMAILLLCLLLFVLHLPIATCAFIILPILCCSAYLFLSDHWIIYTVFLSHILFLDFLFKDHDLFEAIMPISFVVLFARRLLKQNLDFLFLLRKSWPFLLFFLIGFYWFAQKGMMPTSFSGKDALGMGNFSVFYNILLNMLALLIPFMTAIKEEDLSNFLRMLLCLFIVKAIFLMIHVVSKGSFYFPFFISFTKTLHATTFISSQVSRIGQFSRISYILILFTVFFGDDFRKCLKMLLILSAMGLNIVWGGGRVDLMCSIFTIMFVRTIRNRRIDLREFVISSSRLLGTLAVLVVFFNLFASFLPTNQQKRFGEIIRLKDAYENRLDKDHSRIEMWRYALKESLKKPLLGHGISQYWDIEKYEIGAQGFVSVGGAHNKYISILYSFGVIGLLLFLWGSKNLFRKLLYLRSYQSHILWDFLLMYFLANYLIRFFLEGGIKGQYFIFYFFVGYILSYQVSRIIKEHDEN